MCFDKDFLYGFATAAAQIEGGGATSEKLSGRGDSVSLTPTSGLVRGAETFRFGTSFVLRRDISKMEVMSKRPAVIYPVSKKM